MSRLDDPWRPIPLVSRALQAMIRLPGCLNDSLLAKVLKCRERAQWWYASQMLAEKPPGMDIGGIKHDHIRSLEPRQKVLDDLGDRIAGGDCHDELGLRISASKFLDHCLD